MASPRSKKSTKDSKSGAATPSAPRAPRAAKRRAVKPTPRARASKAVISAAEPVGLPVAPDFLEFLPQKPASMVRSGPRHAVFIDVENTSSEADLTRVLEDLRLDRNTTDLTAVGNWRVVGQHLGRMLAQRGAHLLHSAPAPRVPDWSDLWIAVTAGMWLGRAAPGDSICILSDDRAFDAVGDAAARLGVAYRRITYRSSGAAAAVERGAEEGHAGGRRRRRRRRGEGPSASASQSRQHAAHAPAHAAHAARAASPSAEEERHSASLDQIRAAIGRLTAADPVRGVSLDALTVALKAEGFQRPPGSPRLVTRLRRIKGVELLPNGRVRLGGEAPESAQALPADEGVAIEPAGNGAEHAADADGAAESSAGGKRRPRRRGGRRRGGRRHKATAAGPEAGA
ncbi:MAG TPA: NYN domain-containing protein [Candidatus Binatia bacterium]